MIREAGVVLAQYPLTASRPSHGPVRALAPWKFVLQRARRKQTTISFTCKFCVCCMPKNSRVQIGAR